MLAQPLSQVMTRKVVTCSPAETIGVIMERMTAGKFRHVPVIEQDQVVGVVSIGDETAFASRIFDDLEAQGPSRLRLISQPQSVEQAECDLLVVPVQRGNFDAVVAEIARLRTDCPACSIIVVCIDLLTENIAALLSAGAFDFMCAPYARRELCTRIQRAAGLLPNRRLDESTALSTARSRRRRLGPTPCARDRSA